MSMPFDSFQQGMMTGQQLGSGLRQRRNARELGGLMSSGDVAGARAMAYSQGDLQTGQALDGQVREQAQAERGQQLTGALRSGDFDAATGFADTPEALAQVAQFRSSASEQERVEAARKAGEMAALVGSIQTLPPEQHYMAAQQAAERMGMDPASITPDMVTPQALERLRIQSMGLAAYLQFQDRETDNRRQTEQFQETVRHNRATEGVAQSRESRVSAGRSSSGPRRSGGSTPRPAAPASRPPWERF